MSASGVLASFRGPTYRSVCLASSLVAALLDGLSEQPAAGHSASVSDLRRGVISGVIISFASKLLAWSALSEVAVIDGLPSVVQLIEQRRTSWDIQLQHLFSRELLQLHDQRP